MFDYNKTELLKPPIKVLLKNPYLEYNTPYNETTNELPLHIRIAKYNGAEKFLSIKAGSYAELNFSFHKYWNKGKHNHNDFCISNFIDVLIDLTENFEIDPNFSILHNLEFGVNISLPCSANEFFKAIISYKGKEYSIETFGGNGFMIRFELDQYELKIYNKGLQYGLSENIIRFEIKVRKMAFLTQKKIDIKNYANLLKIENINKLSDLLLNAFNDILIYDNTIDLKAIRNKNERELLMNGRSHQWWVEQKEINVENYKYKKERFKKLVLKYGKSNIQEIVFSLLKTKLETITKIDNETSIKIEKYLSRFNQKTFPEITTPILKTFPEITDLNSNIKTSNIPQNNTSSIGLFQGNSNLSCLPYFWEGATLIKKFNNGSEKLIKKEIEKTETGNDKQRQFCREIQYTGIYKKMPVYEAHIATIPKTEISNPEPTNIISKPKFVVNETADEICERISKGDTKKQNWDKLVSFYETLTPPRNQAQ